MTVTPHKLYSAADLDELAFPEATFPDCTT
jgi:hypothetical protein